MASPHLAITVGSGYLHSTQFASHHMSSHVIFVSSPHPHNKMIESFNGPSRHVQSRYLTLPPNLGGSQSLETMLGENGTCAGCRWTDQTFSNNEYHMNIEKHPNIGRVVSKFPTRGSRGFRHELPGAPRTQDVFFKTRFFVQKRAVSSERNPYLNSLKRTKPVFNLYKKPIFTNLF